MWKSTSVSGAPDNSRKIHEVVFYASLLTESSGPRPSPPRHRADVATMAWRRRRKILISTQVDRAFRDWLKKAWEKDGVLRKASEKGRKRCGNQPASYVTLRIIDLCGDAIMGTPVASMAWGARSLISTQVGRRTAPCGRRLRRVEKRCGNQPVSYVTLRIIELCGDAVI